MFCVYCAVNGNMNSSKNFIWLELDCKCLKKTNQILKSISIKKASSNILPVPLNISINLTGKQVTANSKFCGMQGKTFELLVYR